MRILFWTELFWPSIGGIEVRCLSLASALASRGHEVAVITSHGNEPLPDDDSINGIAIFRFRFLEALASRRLDLFASERRRLATVKGRFRPDVVHVMFTDPTVLFHWQTQQARPCPTVVSIPIGIESLEAGPDTLLHHTLCDAAWTVAVSEAMLDDVLRLVPEISGRSSVIHNSIDEPEMQPSPLPFDPPQLLCLGRVVREKGFDIAIDAFSRMKRERFPGIRLVIAGDGPAREELEVQAAALDLSDSVIFTGWVQPDDVPALIDSATVMIVPSRWREAFGNVAVQAMQMGRPVIAADVGGIPEIVAEGITGYIVPSESPDILARTMERLLVERETAVRLGAAGRARAVKDFPFERHVDEHEQLYRRIMRYKPKTDNTAATVIDGEAIIVNLTTGVYYSMDKVGAEVWEMMEQGLSLHEISAAIAARHEIEQDKALADIEALAGKLVAEDLIEMSAAPGADAVPPLVGADRLPYAIPSLEIYRDMGDLLALDPPMPGLRDIPFHGTSERSGQ